MEESVLLLPSEVCQILSVGRETINRWTARGILTARRGRWGWRYYDPAEVYRMRNRVKPVDQRQVGQTVLVA